MVLPAVQARIEDFNHLAGVRIRRTCLRPLAQGAGHTSKRQVRERRWAVVPSWPYMVDMKRCFLTYL
jgi:hypothetical protein